MLVMASVNGTSRPLLVFQETALMPWLTTYENVMFGRREGADAMLERVGLAEFRDHYPAQLSGGMQRRAELARALINEPAAADPRRAVPRPRRDDPPPDAGVRRRAAARPAAHDAC